MGPFTRCIIHIYVSLISPYGIIPLDTSGKGHIILTPSNIKAYYVVHGYKLGLFASALLVHPTHIDMVDVDNG